MLEFYIFTKGQSECYESTLISRNELINKIPELACSEPRDLSILDNTSKISHIAIRSKCYVLKLDFIRAIITKDKLYILKIIKNDFVESLKINLHKYQEQNNLYFELNALESILELVSRNITNELNVIIPESIRMLNLVQNNVKEFNPFIRTRHEAINLEYRVKEVFNVITEISEEDEDMSAMYLSVDREINNHVEIENLLETYQKKLEQNQNELLKYMNEMENMKDMIGIVQDNRRNQLATKNLQLTALNICLTGSTVISSLFGMNITNYIEDIDGAFYVFFILLVGVIPTGYMGFTKWYF